MSKNAFVQRPHLSGTDQFRRRQVVEGMDAKLFESQRKAGLVREATDAEVRAAKSNDGIVPANKVARAPLNKMQPSSETKDEPQDDLVGKGVMQLKKIARDEQIDVGSAKTAADLRTAIRSGRSAKNG